MRVLQISNYYFPNYGGIEQVTHDIAQALSEKDIEQKIICFNSDASSGEYATHQKEDSKDIVDGVEVIRCKCTAKIASQSISFTYSKNLNRVIGEFNPDYIILQYPNPYAVYFLLKHRDCGAKLIVFWQSDIVKQKVLGKLFYGLEDKMAEWATILVASSPNYIEGSRILSKYRNKCRVLPNCVNESRLIPSEMIQRRAAEIRNENGNKIVCFAIGRHVPYKGFKFLIQAGRLLDERFVIYIAGTGPLTEELKKEAGDDPKIHFVGRLSQEELIARYKSCDVFCFPSITKNEAFGVVLAEAMYFGKPAVTYEIPGSGVNFVSLAGESGLECRNMDAEDYADALRRLADDSKLREKLGKGAAERSRKYFLYKQFKENIYSLLGI